MKETKVYSNEEKINYYLKKLMAAMAAGAVSKDIFEALYYADQTNWIFYKIQKLMKLEDFE